MAQATWMAYQPTVEMISRATIMPRQIGGMNLVVLRKTFQKKMTAVLAAVKNAPIGRRMIVFSALKANPTVFPSRPNTFDSSATRTMPAP